MDTVGEIDLQFFSTPAIVHHLVHTSRTEAFAGIPVLLPAACGAYRGIGHLQVGGLIGVMDRSRMVDLREFVDEILAIICESGGARS